MISERQDPKEKNWPHEACVKNTAELDFTPVPKEINKKYYCARKQSMPLNNIIVGIIFMTINRIFFFFK